MGAQPKNEQPGSLMPPQAVFEQLDRVLSSPPFQGAERSRRLLRFLVEQTLEGHADGLKEYTLATQALGRSVAFDPRIDAIVRAEASRLRSRLRKYYAREGQTDRLVIDLPKGSYVPHFESRTAPPSRRRPAWMPLSIAAVVSIIAVLLLGLTRVTRPSEEFSIAVLPLANLSLDPDREFFADGVTDEIAAALARVPNLKVVARSSAYAFKNRATPAHDIGRALGATHFVEGSVRQDEGRVRITVQLIKTETGLQLWSAVYDRELTDIFAVQEDIARKVTASLNVTLGLKPSENLVNNRSIDPESHEKYLRSKSLWEERGGAAGNQDQNLRQATALLEGVVAKNPGYAPAWALLSGAYYGLASNSARTADIVSARAAANEFRLKGEAAAQKSVELDSDLAVAYDALAVFAWSRAKLIEADRLFQKALVLDTVEPNLLGAYAFRLGSAGRLKEALSLAERGYRVDPFYPTLARETAQDRWLNGHNESAIALAKTLRSSDRANLLALIYASMRRYNDAADALMEFAGDDPSSNVAQIAHLLRAAPTNPASEEKLPRLPQALSMLYLYLGAPERVLDPYDRSIDVGFLFGSLASVWHPDYAPVRKTEHFKALMRKAGLVQYWRAKGWPDLCRPVGSEDFACD